MKKLNFKWTAVVAIALILGTAFFTSCSKNEVYEPNNVVEVKPEFRKGKVSHYTVSTCELTDGSIGVMCKAGSSDDCWRLIDCKPSQGVLENHYSSRDLYFMIKISNKT